MPSSAQTLARRRERPAVRLDASPASLPLQDPWILGTVLAAICLVLVRNAWVGDDAYISFRVVDNFVHGYGLRWNVEERVQAFTNPLWVLLLAPFYAVTGEIYYTALVVSGVLTLATCALILREFPRTAYGGWIALAGLLLSKSFVDFAVGGLENPLSDLLLILFCCELFRSARPRALVLLASLSAVNRLDSLAFYLPVLLAAFTTKGWRKRPRWQSLVLPGAPLIAWLVFATVYFGFPLPNTFYAKLRTGIPTVEYLQQGLLYLINFAIWDPPSLLLLIGGLVVGVRAPRASAERALGIGLAAHVAYVIYVGGDFMSGRFFSLVVVASIGLLARSEILRDIRLARIALAVLVLTGLLAPRSPLFCWPGYQDRVIDHSGIADEKGWYFAEYGLVHGERPELARSSDYGTAIVVSGSMIGRAGFRHGPRVHLLDHFALSDAFLARLPAPFDPHWRIGHFYRPFPPGYSEAAFNGNAAMLSPGLRDLFTKVSLVTRGPLWTAARWRAIWDLNTGGDRLPAQEALGVRYPYAILNASRFRTPVPDGELYESSAVYRTVTPFFVTWDQPVRGARTLRISVDHNDDYSVYFFDGTRPVGELLLAGLSAQGLIERRADIPRAARGGFDRVLIFPSAGDGKYALGHLIAE